MRPSHWLGLVLYVPFRALTWWLGGRKNIQPVKNHAALIFGGFLLEQVEEKDSRGNQLTQDHLESGCQTGVCVSQVRGGSNAPSASSDFHIPVESLNSLLTCSLCSGYLHNAVTITECLHSCMCSSSFSHVMYFSVVAVTVPSYW